MSAEINSLETRANTDNNMEEAVTGVNELTIESDEIDAADFLLSNSKFHDCFLTVGNPETDKIESIGVSSAYLFANSPVFRKMLGSYKQANLSHAKIIVSDISPAPFKLMLRYLYGGELPKMTAIETAGLALCADKYKITRLVQETLKRLNPTSAEDVFPALICVTYTSFPDLEVQVCEIIQRETDKVVQSADFLKLDEACVIFILKQNTLNIDEVELWKHVVHWAEHQVEINPTRTVRDCLAKILGYVRFLTFTSEEILEHVLPTKILTSDEFVDLALGVSKKQVLQSSALCNIQEKRGDYQEEDVTAQSTLDKEDNKTKDDVIVLQNKSENNPESVMFNKSCVFRAYDYFTVALKKHNCSSSLTIEPFELIEIESFTCKSKNDKTNRMYTYKCDITMNNIEEECIKYKQKIRIEGSATTNGEIVLPLKFNSGNPIVMKPDEEWVFNLCWHDCHPVHELLQPDDTPHVIVNGNPLDDENITVIYNDPFHVVEVAYKKQ